MISDKKNIFHKIGKLISQVSRHQELLVSREMKKNNIPLERAQIRTFMTIAEHEGIFQKEIAEKHKADKKAIAKIVKRLIKSNMVVTKKDDHDGRILRLYLSDKARRCLPLFIDILEDISQKSLLNFTDSEQNQLYRLLSKLETNFSGFLTGIF